MVNPTSSSACSSSTSMTSSTDYYTANGEPFSPVNQIYASINYTDNYLEKPVCALGGSPEDDPKSLLKEVSFPSMGSTSSVFTSTLSTKASPEEDAEGISKRFQTMKVTTTASPGTPLPRPSGTFSFSGEDDEDLPPLADIDDPYPKKKVEGRNDGDIKMREEGIYTLKRSSADIGPYLKSVPLATLLPAPGKQFVLSQDTPFFAPLYHGELTRERACELLKHQGAGTILLRASANSPNALCLSGVGSTRFWHLRFGKIDGFIYLLDENGAQASIWKQRGRSFEEAIMLYFIAHPMTCKAYLPPLVPAQIPKKFLGMG